MIEEIYALHKNDTWSLVSLPKNRQVVGCKWVYKIKRNADGSISRYKARLVAKGFNQIAGLDFSETFSPVVKQATVRVMLTIALAKGWTIRQLDVNNAFLNGTIEYEVYMQQPPGFEDLKRPNLVCKLKRALYGLKQAPKAWFDKFKSSLQRNGFTSSKADNSLFFKFSQSPCLFVLVYVDDIIVTGSSNIEIQKLIYSLDTAFSLKDLGNLHYFLGIKVTTTATGLHLSQTKYINDLLKRANMDQSKPLPTPMISRVHLSATNGTPFEDSKQYRSLVGALQYVTITRPEIAFSVNKLSQYMQCPLDQHWKALKRVLRYLKGITTYGLNLLNLIGFSDSDWATDLDDKRSVSGICVFLGNNLVSWSSKK